MQKLYLFTLLLLLCLPVTAQDTFRGTVQDADGQGITRAVVTIFDESENVVERLFTDDNGRFISEVSASGQVTSVDGELAGPYHLSLAYPNPLQGGKLHFVYRSLRGEAPVIEFFTFSGKSLVPGQTIPAGTYLYRASFQGAPEHNTEGVFSVIAPQRFEVSMEPAPVNRNEEPGVEKNNTSGRTASLLQVIRLEIEKDGFITLNEQVDLNALETLDQSYSLTNAPAPSAVFSILPTPAEAGQIVSFDASASTGASGETLTYQWEFGDGTNSSGVISPHIYLNEGAFEVTLTVTGAYGATNAVTQSVTISEPSLPAGTAAIRGIVTDIQGNPLPGVQVEVPHLNQIFTSAADGEVAFDGFVTGRSRQMIFSREGYVTEFYALNVQSGARQSYFELTLIEQEAPVVAENVEFGATVTGKDGTSVTLPVEGLVHADGSLVTGNVDVYMTPVDISDDGAIGAFPGEFRGLDADGEVPLILSYGTADFVFIQNGERLQLAPGKKAEITLPVYATQDETGADLQTGDEFPFWSYAEASGEWIREGTSLLESSGDSPSGFVARGEVTHFSWWNCDIAPDPYYPIPECKTPLNESGVPVLKIPENGACFIKGKLLSGSGPRGNPSTPNCCVPLPIPPNSDMELTGTAGNGLYRGTVVVNGVAGVEEIVEIQLERVAGYGQLAGRISPDTVFTSAIEEAGQTDAYTLNEQPGTAALVSVSAADGSTLEGTLEIRDPDNLPIGKRSFSGNQTASFLLEVDKTGDYQIIVDGTANEPGAYEVVLNTTTVLTLDTNTESVLEVANQTLRYVVDLQEGQIILPSVSADQFSGRVTVQVFDPSGTRVATQRSSGFIQTPVLEAATTGVYSITVTGVDASSVGPFVLGLPELDPPQDITVDGDLTQVNGEITIIGDRKYYRYTDEVQARRKYALHTPGTSTGNIVVRQPGDGPFYSRQSFQAVRTTNQSEVARWGITQLRSLPATGEYIIEINSSALTPLENQTGAFEFFVIRPTVGTISINSEVSGDLPAYFDQINGLDHYTFTAEEGDLLNVAYTDDIAGRNILFLIDENGNGVKSIRDGQELGVQRLSAGTYTIELSGVDRGRSQGTYTIGLSRAEPPTPITKASPFVTVDGEVDIIGRKRYYSLPLTLNERINIGITNGPDLQAGLNLKRVSTDPFYARQNFSSISAGAGASRETRVFSSPEDGEIILEVNPSKFANPTGTFRIYVGQQDILPVSLNTVIDGELSRDLGAFSPFDRYRITAPASNAISVSFTWDNPGTFADRIYITVLDTAGDIVFRQRTFNSGVINLPGAGDYVVEIESVDNPNDTYNLIINEE